MFQSQAGGVFHLACHGASIAWEATLCNSLREACFLGGFWQVQDGRGMSPLPCEAACRGQREALHKRDIAAPRAELFRLDDKQLVIFGQGTTDCLHLADTTGT